MNSPDVAPIVRSFVDVSDAALAEASALSGFEPWLGFRGASWTELLSARRILIVSEAGAGKTYECQKCQERLWQVGEPAFFLELAVLAKSDLRSMLYGEELRRFEMWLAAQSDLATFFLDSIDELRVGQESFEQALKKLASAIDGHLGRARIIITTRPIPVDRQLIERHLPFPQAAARATVESFADIAMGSARKAPEKEGTPSPWRAVVLAPLNRDQILEFAKLEGVAEPDKLVADIVHRNALDYASRPQDLIELCSDWREHRRLRKHAEQVASNVANKLKPRQGRVEKAELSQEKAYDGATRLALLAVLARKFTIRHNAESDRLIGAEPALDASKVLTDWTQAERDTLLERPLFGVANYGRVRFHHRSVLEYLAAKRIEALRKRGASIRAIKRLLFCTTAQGDEVLRTNMRASAAWLAAWEPVVFQEILRREPEVLLIHGDPQSLNERQLSSALKAFAGRYGVGGWRGIEVPVAQIKRLATADLAATILEIWKSGVSNFEVRELLLSLIAEGRMTHCADIAYDVAVDTNAAHGERVEAINALLQLQDSRLPTLVSSIVAQDSIWTAPLARSAVAALFPVHMSAKQLIDVLAWLHDPEASAGNLPWHISRAIEENPPSAGEAEVLREGLTHLVASGVKWEEQHWPHLATARGDLVELLAVSCNGQLSSGMRQLPLLRSAVLANRFSHEDHRDNEPYKRLRAHLHALAPEHRECAFIEDLQFLESIRPAKDAWNRYFMLSDHGGIQIGEQDRAWIMRRLADPAAAPLEREVMLWGVMTTLAPSGPEHLTYLEGLKPRLGGDAALLAIVERRLTPNPEQAQFDEMQRKSKEHSEKRKKENAEARQSWVDFGKEIESRPDELFNEENAANTAWNLWRVMRAQAQGSRAEGWNRAFIEQQFGRPIADRLRDVMKDTWREETPRLPSERPAGERNTVLGRWIFGLAGLYAAAEEPQWAQRLSLSEAQQVARYVPVEINGFPSWFETLAAAHPIAVDSVLGPEFSTSLDEKDTGSEATIWLQNLRHASTHVHGIFLPRVLAWVRKVEAEMLEKEDPRLPRLQRALELLLKFEMETKREELSQVAERQVQARPLTHPQAQMWLSILLQLNAEKAVDALEKGLATVAVEKESLAVQLLGSLFDGDARSSGANLQSFSPRLLLRLVRLAYRHVDPAQDARREGSYSPDARDIGERGRNALLNALLATSGADGFQVKLELAQDPLVARLKDRLLALSRETATEEASGTPSSETEVLLLEKVGELPANNRDDMFTLLIDRLDDIDDMLKQDESPRELWSTIDDEKLLRRTLAGELRTLSNGMYSVEQEGVTAEEKETDIRLRSTGSHHQAVIELKIGEKARSAADLRDAIKDQLVGKYLGPEERRAGCLLVSVATDRQWQHPATGHKMGFADLILYLNGEAQRLAADMHGSVRLAARGLDLRKP